jgi:hypothetical protein
MPALFALDLVGELQVIVPRDAAMAAASLTVGIDVTDLD